MVDDLKWIYDKEEERPMPMSMVPLGTLLVPLMRYEELIEAETRIDILSDLLEKDGEIDNETLAVVCGYPKMAARFKKEKEEYWKSIMNKGDEKDEDSESNL